jgi:hypothetical protein
MVEQFPDPIVVFGAPRSGTTYVQEILNAHPEIYVSHETRVFAWLNDAVNGLTKDDRCLVTYRNEFIDLLRASLPQLIRDFYRSLAPGARYWGDKNPHYADQKNAGCLELIAELFPTARFVDVIRDGRDVVSSLLRMQHDDGSPWVDFESAHHTWTSHVDRGREFSATLPVESYCLVRYEELVADDVASANALFDFLGIDFDPQVAAFCEAERVRRTPFSNPTRDLSGAVRTSDWGDVLDPARQSVSLALIGEGLVRHGYETEDTLAEAQQRVATAAAADR